MRLGIVGGTYYEVCRDPDWDELYGSGLRAVHALSRNDCNICFYTFIGKDDLNSLEVILASIKVELRANVIPETIEFFYDYPLDKPSCSIPDLSSKDRLDVEEELVLQYGMIEESVSIKAKRVVYDPQAPTLPKSFWLNDSFAEELIWICNYQEVINFTGQTETTLIKEFMFQTENVKAFVVKNGADGATLFQKDKDDFQIPAYETDHVWPIGTGDIFSSILAFSYLIEGNSLEYSSSRASIATAYYANSGILPIPKILDSSKFRKFFRVGSARKSIYLAGPFFNMSERWILSQFREQFLKLELTVFSPYHDVGLGSADDVYSLDIDALKRSDMVFAILDGLDSGTIFEIGFAKANQIPVIVFGENLNTESMTMIEGSDCIIENDFSTAVYRTIWELYK